MPRPAVASKEPAMSDAEMILDDHAERLRRLEDLQITFGPLVARIDQRLEGIQSDVGDLKRGLQEVKTATTAGAARDAERDSRVTDLEEAAKKQVERRNGLIKYIGGILATVVATALLVKLGLK